MVLILLARGGAVMLVSAASPHPMTASGDRILR
jgi:hypothetical protein